MFGFLRRKKVKEEPKPQYVYDAEIRFKDGHIFTITAASYISHHSCWGKREWLVAEDGNEEKHIHTDEAEEVTITRKRIDIDEGINTGD